MTNRIPRHPPLRPPPIAFAHRGARAHARENTIEAFELALKLGATGLESDVWLTADGVPVLDHDGKVGRVRRKSLGSVRRDELPDHIPSLAEFYEACGSDFELSLDLKDPASAESVLAIAGTDPPALQRLWLCHPDLDVVISLRERSEAVRLVNSTRLGVIKEGPERRAAALHAANIDALNLRESDWSGGLVALIHRFGRFAFGWDAQHDRQIEMLVDMGIDAIYSDHVDRLVTTIAQFYP